MPNKRRRVGPGRRRATGGGRAFPTTKIHFHALNSTTLVGGQSSVQLGTNNGISDRVTTIADTFQEYRVIRLKYRIRVDLITGTNNGYMALFPGAPTTGPNSALQMGENPLVSARVTDDDVIVPWVNVPRALLAGEQSWYKSLKATINSDDQIPATFFFLGTTTDALLYELDGVFEFRGESDPGNTPLDASELTRRIDILNKRVALGQKERTAARDKLLKLLNYREESVVIPQITRWPPPSQ